MSDDDKLALDPRAFDPGDLKRLGLGAWLPGDRIPHELYFGTDRSQPASMREYSCKRKLTLCERIKGAWRGMVNGWRGAQ